MKAERVQSGNTGESRLVHSCWVWSSLSREHIHNNNSIHLLLCLQNRHIQSNSSLSHIFICFSSSSQSEQPSPAGSSSSSSFAPTPHKRQGNRLGPCTQVTKFSLCCLLVTLTSYVTLCAVKAMKPINCTALICLCFRD